MPIFVEHWGDNLQFYLNFALFSTLGGMNLDYVFVQVWKFSEHQKKNANGTLFCPNSGEDQKKVFIKNRTLFSPNTGDDKIKKKVFNKNRTLFSQNLRSDVHAFKLLGGMQPNYWGVYPPSSPCFNSPAWIRQFRLQQLSLLGGFLTNKNASYRTRQELTKSTG